VSALPDGSVFVVGSFFGNARFGGTTLAASGGEQGHDVFVAKYSASGALVWAANAGFASFEPTASIATLANGTAYVTSAYRELTKFRADGSVAWTSTLQGTNVLATSVAALADGTAYVTGSFEGSVTWGGTTLTSAGASDIFLTKFDANGAVVWARRAGGTTPDSGTSVSLLADGTAYVAGAFASFGLFLGRYTAAGDLVWSVERGLPNGRHAPVSVNALADGSAYVAGAFQGTLAFGSIMLRSTDVDLDGYVVKYSSSGAPVWAVAFGSSSDDPPIGSAVLPNGTVYVAGTFLGATRFATTTLTGRAKDFYLARYDAAGAFVSAAQGGMISGSTVQVNDVEALADGSLYVTGGISEVVDFGSTRLTADEFGYDLFLAKCDANGTPVWAVRAGGPNSDAGVSLAALPDGSVYVAGSFGESARFGATTLVGRHSEAFLAKYAANGTLLWARSAGGYDNDEGRAVAVSSDGSALLAGTFRQSVTIGGASPPPKSNGTDFFLAKYDTDGNFVWVSRQGGSGAHAVPNSVSVLADGSSYATGVFGGPVSFDAITLTPPAASMFVVKYAADGSVTSASAVAGTSTVEGTSVAALPDGTAYVTGYFLGTANFGVSSLPSPAGVTDADVFVAKYQGATPLWAVQSGTASGRGERVAALPDGSAYVAGTYRVPSGNNSPQPFGNAMLTPVGGGIDLFVAKYNGNGTLAWVTNAGGIREDTLTGLATFDGAAFVVGNFVMDTRFGGTTLENYGTYEGFLAKAKRAP